MQGDETVLAVGMSEAARRLGLSARTVATLVSCHELPSRKVGRRRIIPIAALEAFIGRDHLNVQPVLSVKGTTTG
jgi:excisionase family DNA binding protein